MDWISYAFIIAILTFIYFIRRRGRRSRQLAYIRDYHFHTSIRGKLQKKHPQLSVEQSHMVFKALRDYFWMCNMSNKQMVAMPSQIVDDAWHEFILFTRFYKNFCDKALGRFLHHTPTEAMSAPTLATNGIKRAWRLACAKEGISPGTPHKLPLIFAIDSLLNIENGFKYELDCTRKSASATGDRYCAGHIGCSGGCAGDSGSHSDSGGFFDSLFDSSSTGCGADCGGGCGGD